MTELAQSFANLFDVFLSNHSSERSVFGLPNSIEGFWFDTGFVRSPNSSIDRQSNGDLAQPATESFRFEQLRQLSKRSQENFLNDFVSFRRVPQPLHHDSVDARLKQNNQIVERFPIAGLGSQNKRSKRISSHMSDSSLKITLPHPEDCLWQDSDEP